MYLMYRTSEAMRSLIEVLYTKNFKIEQSYIVCFDYGMPTLFGPFQKTTIFRTMMIFATKMLDGSIPNKFDFGVLKAGNKTLSTIGYCKLNIQKSRKSTGKKYLLSKTSN